MLSVVDNKRGEKYSFKEWVFVYTVRQKSRCICGQPIIENCIFKNKFNSKYITVGNVCVQKFFNRNYKEHFNIKFLLNKYYSGQLLYFLKDEKVINEFEFNFINSLPTYSKYSSKQTNLFFKIHQKIFKYRNEINTSQYMF